MKILNLVTLLILTSNSYAVCDPNITPTAPNNRYELVNNGIEVKDLQTGLIWQRCSLGQTWSGTTCTGTAATYNWINALRTTVNMGNGWRVPNIKELASLVEQACYNPSINETYFSNTASNYYWSASPVSDEKNTAWVVNFHNGNVHGFYGADKSNSNYVRLVRYSQ